MAEPCRLETISPELQLQIILQCQNTYDLNALIRASPRLYQVLRTNKQVALSVIARRQFYPSTMLEALAVSRLSECQHPLSRDVTLKFIATSRPEYLGRLDSISPLSTSTTLLNLHSVINFFIDDYARNNLPVLAKWKAYQDFAIAPDYQMCDPASQPLLSESEYARLQRAFCRFEIYRHLFTRCSTDTEYDPDRDFPECSWNPDVTIPEQADYLQTYPQSEIEEINCIRDYFHRRLRGVFDRVEDEALLRLQAGGFQLLQESLFQDGAYCDSYLSGFGSYEKSHQKYHIEHLLSLGLPYLRRILESTGTEREDLFIRGVGGLTLMHREENFLTAALETLSYRPNDTDASLQIDRPTSADLSPSLEQSCGWLWAHGDKPHWMVVDSASKGLRDWGYVFWDETRLRESGILSQK